MIFGVNGLGTRAFGSIRTGVNTNVITVEIDNYLHVIRAYMTVGLDEPKTIVINLKDFAVSEYKRFNFNSYDYFNNANMACSTNGIYELDNATDDDGFTIQWAFRLPLFDSYTDSKQRIDRMYMVYETDGKIVLTLEGDGELIGQTIIPADQTNITYEKRLKIGRGVKSRHYDFKFENFSGSKIDVDNIRFLLEPLVTRRR